MNHFYESSKPLSAHNDFLYICFAAVRDSFILSSLRWKAAKPSALAQRTNQETSYVHFLWRKEKNEKKHPPPTKPPPIWGDLTRKSRKPTTSWLFWYRGTRDDFFIGCARNYTLTCGRDCSRLTDWKRTLVCTRLIAAFIIYYHWINTGVWGRAR